MKLCNTCGVTKALELFAVEKKRKDGRRAQCKECQAIRKRKWDVKNLYGLEWEEYTAMLEEQQAKCYVCKKVKPLVVDHCHTSGKARRLLCDGCNTAFGLLKEDPQTIEALLNYSREYEPATLDSPKESGNEGVFEPHSPHNPTP